MFEYILPQRSLWNFWGPNPLLKRIQVQGPFVTIYGRKTVGEELSCVIDELKGKVIQGDDFEHFTIHDMADHPFGWSIENPHIHYILPQKDMEQAVIDLITSIFKREVPAAREKDYKDILASVEKDRLKAGDKELPDYVKRSIAQYDQYSPFFLSPNCQELLQDILSKYREYRTRPSNDRCRELIQMYAIGIFKPIPSLPDDKGAQAQAENLLKPLVEILTHLQKFQKKPLTKEVALQIQRLISEVNVEELVKLENPEFAYLIKDVTLKERLAFISKFIQESLAPEKSKTIRPISAYPSASRISLFFYAVMSRPFVKYGLLALAVILVFQKSMKTVLSAKV